MAIIARLEQHARGPYCERSDGPKGKDGLEASFAVPIRTVVLDGATHHTSYGVGAVIPSDPPPTKSGMNSLRRQKYSSRRRTSLASSRRSVLTLGSDTSESRSPPRSDGGFCLQARSPIRTSRGNHPASGELSRPPGPGRVRIILDPSGSIDIEIVPLDSDDKSPVRLAFASRPIDRTDRRLYDKTTDRGRYDEFLPPPSSGIDDVVLWNREGEVTETTRANVLAYFDGSWWTPPVACGLLPGIGRARLLVESGEVTERSISRAELCLAEQIEVVSSLRGRRRAVLVDVAMLTPLEVEHSATVVAT